MDANINIREMIRKYEEKYLLLKEINFYEDIDQEISGIYAIDSKKSMLRFICNNLNANSMNEKNFFPVMGNVESEAEGVEFLPMLANGQFLHNVSRAIFMEPFDPAIDSIAIFHFTYRNNCTTNLVFLSEEGYELANKAKEKTEDDYAAILQSKGNLLFSIGKNLTYAYTYNNGKQDVIFKYSKDSLMETNLCAVIDAKKGIFDLIELGMTSNLKIHVRSSSMVLDSKKYCYIGWYDKYNGNSESQWNCHNILYGNQPGYIFFKPIHVNAQKIKVLLAYQGNMKLEYCSGNDSEWKEILNNEELLVKDGELRFRVYINYGDALFKFNIYKLE